MFEIRFDIHLAGDRKREFYIGSRQQQPLQRLSIDSEIKMQMRQVK